MASEEQKRDVRFDLGLVDTEEVNDDIDYIYTRSDDKYGANTQSSDYYARVLLLNRIIMDAAKRPDYVANEKSLSMDQIFENLVKIRDRYQKDLDEESDDTVVNFGSLRPYPSYKEYPNDHPKYRGRFR